MMKPGKIKQRLLLNRQRHVVLPLERADPQNEGLKVISMKPLICDYESQDLARKHSSIGLKNFPLIADVCKDNTRSFRNRNSFSCTQGRSKIRFRSLADQRRKNSLQKEQQTECGSDWMKPFVSQFVDSLRTTDKYISKRNLFQFPHATLLATLLKFTEKLLDEKEKHQVIAQLSKPSLSASTASQQSAKSLSNKLFKIEKQYNSKIEFHKPRGESAICRSINFQVKYEEAVGQEELFWKLVEKTSTNTNSQEEFAFLMKKMNILKHCTLEKELFLQKMEAEAEALQLKTERQNIISHAIQKTIHERQKSLERIEKEIRDIKQFLYDQPNKILRLEAEGYKEQEQELFDFACCLEDSVPLEVSTWVQQSTLVHRESLQLTLRTFPHEKAESSTGLISLNLGQIEAFKNSLKVTHDLIISKLQSFLETKCEKIRLFIKTMRRLASYTIGKREYLSEINKKMAIVNVLREKCIDRLMIQVIKDRQTNTSSANGKKQKEGQETKVNNLYDLLVELKNLCLKTKQIYEEAQVFY